MAVIDQLKLLFTPTLTEAQILTVYHRVNFDLEEAVLQLSLQLDQMELAGGKSANCIPPVKKDRGPLTKLDSDQSKKDLDLLQGMFTEKAIKELQQLYNKFKGNVDDVVQHVLSQPRSQNAITNAKKQNNKQGKKVNQVKANNQPKNTTTTATTATTTTKSAKQAKNAPKWNKQKMTVSKETDVPQTITLDPTAYPIFSCTKPEKPAKKKTSSKFNWDRQCYLKWSNAQWEEFNSTLGQVKSIFPTLSNFTMIHSFLKNDGDLSQTLECCCQTSEYIQNQGISDTDHAYNIELESNCDNLIDMFPTFSRFQLVLLLIICQNNMDAALQSLLDMQYIIQSNLSTSSTSHSSSKKKPTFTPAPDLLKAKYNNKGNILNLNVNEGPSLSLNEDAVLSLRHSSREILDDPDIYRERAQDFYEKRNGLYEKAVNRHKNRNKRNNHAGVAFYYAEEGRDLERKAQFQNELAVRSLINEKLANRSDPYEVDLHGFRVQEAIDFALEQCSIWYIRDMKRVESGRCRKLHPLTFVTGKGVHNADQKSRLMPALVRKFREEGWKVEPNTGYFRILGVDESTRKG